MSKWISVEDGLPKSYELVRLQGCVGYWLSNKGCWMDVTGCGYPGRKIERKVTYWMPLKRRLPERE